MDSEEIYPEIVNWIDPHISKQWHRMIEWIPKASYPNEVTELESYGPMKSTGDKIGPFLISN